MVGAGVDEGAAVAGGGRLARGDGSAGARVTVAAPGSRVGVETAINGVTEGSGVGVAVKVDGAVGDGGAIVGVDSGDAKVAAGDGALVRVAVGAATNSPDVAVASGLTPRGGVAD